jgi:UPF0271 protein
MRACLRLCHRLRVNAGAHPGLEDRKNFGRKEEAVSPAKLQVLISSQVGKLVSLAHEEGIQLAHIKLHGGLYHVVERDKELARDYATFIKEHFPGVRLIASPRGELIGAARSCGVEVWGELFSDRAYSPSGGLVPRGQPGAVLTDLAEIQRRMEKFQASGRISATDGTLLVLDAQTVCVHADSPNALLVARLLASLFRFPGESHSPGGSSALL